jgi:ferric-dicitrate binding protein FerR (iron transport regulator)
MHVMSHLCERAHAWASLRVDGELSSLESALLDAHLERCASCRRFIQEAEVVAAMLRSARLERPAPLALSRPRRHTPLRALQAGAAGALIVACGAAATLLRTPPPASPAKPVAVVASGESPDVVRALRRTILVEQGRSAAVTGRMHGESV